MIKVERAGGAVSTSHEHEEQPHHNILHGLDFSVQRAVLAAAGHRRMKRNAILFHEGDPADAIYVLKTGAATIRKSLVTPEQQVIGFLYPGDILGTAYAQRYAYSVRMLSNAEVLRFNFATFEDLCGNYPEFGHWLLQAACSELAAAQDHMLLLGRKTARERVASFLVRLEERLSRHDAGPAVWMPMRRGEIAEHLGVALETVSRIMTEFARRGLIRTQGRHVVYILDRQELTALAEGAGTFYE